MSNFSLNVKINGVEQAVSSIGQIEEALNATRNELKNVEIGSQAFEELGQQARALQGTLENSFERFTNFNANLDNFTQAAGRLGSTVASGFTIALSAVQIFGSEAEELTEAQIKAQQVLAIAFAATTIATNSAKLASDAKLITDKLQLGITQLLTTAFGRETAAKAASAVATGGATLAQRALNAAMNANPILLLVSALGALVGSLFLFSSSSKQATEDTDDLSEAKQRYNDELDRTTKAITEEISKQKELIKLQGQIREAEAKTNEEKLKIRQETNAKLGQLDLDALDEEKKNLQTKLGNERRALESSTTFVRLQLEKQKELQDFNVESFLDDQQKEIAALIRRQEFGTISTENYYKELLKIRLRYSRGEERKELKEIEKTYKELEGSITTINGQIEVQNEKRKTDEKLTNIEIQNAQRENLKKRKEELEAFNKDVDNLNMKRRDDALKIERELTDFQLDRISQVTETFEFEGQQFTITNEDIIKGYDERIAIIQETFKRQKEDARIAFEDEIKNFEKTERKRVDINGKRVVSDAQIQKSIEEQRQTFEANELAREENFSLKVQEIEQDKANKILEIDDVLSREVAFGDNNLADNRTRIALEAVDLEIAISERRIATLRGFNLQVLKDRQDAERKKIELLKKAQIEELQIQTIEALKSVQGTEKQKGKQREEINRLYNERLKRINDDYRSQEQAAEKKNADEILQYKLQTLERYGQFINQSLNTALGLFQAISELSNVQRENELTNLRDSIAEQQNILNESYNAELEALQIKYEQGLVTQEQYNAAVESLNDKLAGATKKLQDKQAAEELAAKKKAFENEKKLKIASAIINGIQGALTAFTGAFQLGPIAGPIVGAVLAALVAATTGIQVAAIAKTKFDSGAPSITPPNTAGAGSSVGGAANLGAATSTGGFTQFDQSLTGSPTGGSSGSGQNGADPVKVYVLESDITATQNRVNVAESNGTIG